MNRNPKTENWANYDTTKYQAQQTCDAYLEYSRKGLYEIEIAGKLNVTTQTLRNWAERYPDFALAREKGKQLCEAWWIDYFRGRAIGAAEFASGDFQSAKWITMNKFGWGDNSKQHMQVETTPKLVVEFVEPADAENKSSDAEKRLK